MRNLVTGVLLALSISSVNAQSTVKTSLEEVKTPALAQQRENLKKEILAQYLAVKQSLVISDSVQAAKSAAELLTALRQFKFKGLTLEEMNTATSMRTKLEGWSKDIAASHHINAQRKTMMELSAGMWTIIARLVPAQTVLYQQTCPMVGKVWISDSKEIKNPYFPKNMLTCGAVTGAIGNES